MRRIPRRVIVLHRDRLLLEQLAVAARMESWTVDRLASWEELAEAVAAAPASSLVIVDPYEGQPLGRSEPTVELAALLNRFPSLTVTAALAALPGRLEHVRRLGEWGVVQIVDLEEERTGIALIDRLQFARGRPLRSLIERVLPRDSSGVARAILRAATTVVVDGGQGKDLARSLHVTSRTLLRWCRRAGLPAPRSLLAWMRILLAAELIDDPGRTVSDVALACGYASDSSLRRAIRTFVELTPTELREQGAFDTAARGFVQALAAARSSRKRYRARSRTSDRAAVAR